VIGSCLPRHAAQLGDHDRAGEFFRRVPEVDFKDPEAPNQLGVLASAGTPL
jgi:hypothetical protein